MVARLTLRVLVLIHLDASYKPTLHTERRMDAESGRRMDAESGATAKYKADDGSLLQIILKDFIDQY